MIVYLRIGLFHYVMICCYNEKPKIYCGALHLWQRFQMYCYKYFAALLLFYMSKDTGRAKISGDRYWWATSIKMSKYFQLIKAQSHNHTTN